MRPQDPARVEDLLANLRNRNRVHVRLALTHDKDGMWVGRSLVVDVYPDIWANELQAGFADSAYVPPVLAPNYGHALFYMGFLSGAMVADWLSHPDECTLAEYDNRPRHLRDRVHFQLPKLGEQTISTRYNSNEADSYATLPWPHDFHACQLKDASNLERSGDRRPLVADGEDPYDDFFEARAFFIHDTTDAYRPEVRQDSVVIRVVEGIGWIQNIIGSGRQYTVTVGGLGVIGCQLHVRSKGSGEQSRKSVTVWNHTTPIALDSEPWPPLTFILFRNNQELDRRVYEQIEQIEPIEPLQPTDPPSDAPAEGQPVEPSAPVAPTVPPGMFWWSTVQPAEAPAPETAQTDKSSYRQAPAEESGSERTLRVVVASPSDVPRERKSLEAVVNELNDNLAAALGLHLKLVNWETDTYPDFHLDGPQGLIDEILRIEEADIVIGIFWTHFGTPVKDAQSGTEHELQKAYEAWHKQGHPHTMVYFNQRLYRPKNRAEIAQLDAVYAFQERLRDKGKYSTYPNAARFPDIVRQDLQKLLRKHYAHG